MKRASDIKNGSATVVRHEQGGWALPGRRVTYSVSEAEREAAMISARFGADPVKTASAGILPPPGVEIIRRQVQGIDATRWGVSVP